MACGIVACISFGIGAEDQDAKRKNPTIGDLSPQILRTPILVTQLLQQYHFAKQPLDAAKANEWIKAYMEALDYSHMLFLKSDVDEMQKKYVADLPQRAMQGDVSPAFGIYELFVQRVHQRVAWVKKRLGQPFDFKSDDEYEFDRSRADWPTSAQEADLLWEKRLKFDLLQLKLSRIKKEEPLKAVTKRYDRLVRTALDYDSEDILQTYLSALAGLYDPHSQYMGPSMLEDFSIGMKLALVGIGAVLTSEDGYCTIKEVIPGGPADLDKRLKMNDKIVAVAQGNEPYVDVVDMKLRNVVKLIRGEKGTIVRLKVNPATASDPSVFTEIKLVRDKIELTAQQASAQVIPVTAPDGSVKKIGLIELPSFYGDVGSDEEDQAQGVVPHSTTEDVALLIDYLKKQGIDALVLDLRRNGGGLLDEAVRLTGLFIERGPVVQVKDNNGRIQVRADKDVAVAYKGPLFVLTSRLSASASEILAGALQNYGRALIIGDKSTHGKGTVQAVVELGKFMPTNPSGQNTPVGALKLTIQKFYLPNGHSTQNRGVVPDISLPSPNDYLKIGEADAPHALPWDEIRPSKFKRDERISQPTLSMLKTRSAERVRSDALFGLLMEYIERLRKRMETGRISLNEAKRVQEKDAEEKRRKKIREQEQASVHDFKKIPRYIVKQELNQKPSIELSNIPEKKESDDPEEEQASYDSDMHLIETLNIVNDWMESQRVATPATVVANKGLE